MTASTLEVALVLLDDADQNHYGYDLSKRTHLRSGVLYPILQRMFDQGWLDDGWESPAPADRPARRYYKVTERGVQELASLARRAAMEGSLLRRFPEAARYA
jgi:PadR family transcriptional regulator PadR